MQSIIQKLEKLKKEPISKVVSERMQEFQQHSSENHEKIFSELCFCLLTANFQAEKSIKIQKEIEHEFETISQQELALKLKSMGHRFWPQRAERIVLARNCKNELCEMVFKKSGKEIREWIVKNVKGLGMKEASHFLRNIGYTDVAILDFHIIDILVEEGLIERPKTITPKRYLEIEKVLEDLGKKVDLNLGELDLYLWYLETGKVLK